MGIRYYAYAFDADVTDQVLADPRRFLSADPLADAWGLESVGEFTVATFEQAVPEREMLYLDKAWRQLQAFTALSENGEEPRPAFRMFEGQVTMHHDGWEPWVRALPPPELPAIAKDLSDLPDEELGRWLQSFMRFGATLPSTMPLTTSKRRGFVNDLAAAGRGFVYLIG